ncbi:hypothetical protein [Streptomyces chryseus]|uniref:hypothetical protein n=1 Tax=Streptomyces chryseus TaxID=68186 RepID=UPI0019BF9F21|nr:hypothetical protein [Streptomyces chryseus]GGX18298.1 hypothetical protein GCM10010353_36840 [Streptomyces chryseus]
MTIGSPHDERDHDRGTEPASGTRRASGPFRFPGLLAAVGHRWPTLLALALAVATFADGLPAPEFLAALLVVMPLCYLLFGALRAELRPPRVLALQIAGLLGFAAVALTALAVDETLGLHLLAAGWLAHAVWDFAHHRTGKVVPRAWAEWCCVVDACGALAMTLLA